MLRYKIQCSAIRFNAPRLLKTAKNFIGFGSFPNNFFSDFEGAILGALARTYAWMGVLGGSELR